MAGMLTIRYFASLREALGERETLPWSPGLTVATVRQILQARSATHAQVLAQGRAVRSALNQVLCDEAAVVPPEAELAFFPPVTGG
jgi:sulfur-carrier protein